ncbi:hypothetical protein KBA63_04180 [Candidatus Woesebacteria bacterium]|nr:hypothetical protein [Candidatus Woesebacteria bacterium]
MNHWQHEIDNFQEMELKMGNKTVILEYIGEGTVQGEFNDSDDDDAPVLRFSCRENKYDIDGKHDEEMESASYCTNLEINAPLDQKLRLMGLVMEAIQKDDYKHRLEELSHFPNESVENVLTGEEESSRV